MSRRIFAYTVAAAILVHVPARAQVLVYEVFGSYLDSLREQAGIPGLSAAIVDDDRIVWERAYGRQDVGRAIAARPDTPFNADGLTQVFTAAMAMRCAEERRLSLDDRVGDFTAQTSEPNASIRQLLTHTSGPPESPSFALRPSRLAPMVADRARLRRRFVPRDLRKSSDPSRYGRFGARPEHHQSETSS